MSSPHAGLDAWSGCPPRSARDDVQCVRACAGSSWHRAPDVMRPPRVLDDALLEELEALLRRVPRDLVGGRRPDEVLRPGCDPRAALEREGFTAPREAVTWWSWHDGADLEYAPLPAVTFLSVDEAVEAYRTQRWLAENAARAPYMLDELRDPDRWWHPLWLPILGTGTSSPVFLDIQASPAEPPVRQVESHLIGSDDYPLSIAPSMGVLIDALMRFCLTGKYEYNHWQRHWQPADDQWRSLRDIVDEMSGAA
jgi:hypothetical protein